MTRNGRNGQHFDPSSTERKMPIQTVPEMSDRQHVAVTDINNTEKINFHDGYMMGSGSEKQKISSWFLKRKVFLEMMCDTKSSSNIFLIGLLFAVLSGCSISLTVIFLGRIKDILLTDEPTAASFRTGIYEQIIVLTFLIAFTGVTHFGMHLSTTVLGDRIRIHLKRCYDGIHNQKQLDEEVVKEIIENVNLMEKGSESFGMQCRNIATVILSLIICFYYEARLSLAILSAVPLVIILDIFSRRLSKKANVLLSNKFFQTVQMEKELLLLKNPTDNIAKDECLMRLSANMRSCTRQAIFRQVWKSSQHGILSFMLFTLVGCGLLYGGYLLRINPMVKKGDIFIVVLSMTLIIGSISTTAKYCSVIKKGAHAAIYIKNHRQFDHGFMLTQNGNQRNSVNGITTTLISRPGIKNSAVFPKQNLIISFISGTRSVLRNYHNHKLFLLIGFALAIARGFEQAAYNLIMEQVFTALLGDSPNIKVLTLCAIQFSAIGFAAFISGTASTALVTVASEHMAVSFRVILARHLLKITDKEPLSKSEINSLVNDNLSLTVRAKSLYYPKLSELLTRITSITTNIIIGFIFSWEECNFHIYCKSRYCTAAKSLPESLQIMACSASNIRLYAL
uniref:ABC transmembrane type-1 domain-containing protein n=1 Tax=Setaria digitata TaxID=48799 RepID=A0A915Q6F8_9BILA